MPPQAISPQSERSRFGGRHSKEKLEAAILERQPPADDPEVEGMRRGSDCWDTSAAKSP